MGDARRDGGPTPGPVRRLFLDDDPARADLFLAEYPDAVWVQTVAECVERLAEPWDEVHLDHDLGGEHYVDVARDDCGMAVVRWLALEPRRHLRSASFTVHSHNGVAAYLMVLQMKALGLQVSASPFGLGRWKIPPPPPPGVLARLRSWLKRRLRLSGGQSVLYGDDGEDGGGQPPPDADADRPETHRDDDRGASL